MSKCPECSALYTKRQIDQVYCSKRCNGIAGNREMKRGRALYRALYYWRYLRLARARGMMTRLEATKEAAACLLFICREIRMWIAIDTAEGRPPPPKHDHTADRGAQRRVHWPNEERAPEHMGIN